MLYVIFKKEKYWDYNQTYIGLILKMVHVHAWIYTSVTYILFESVLGIFIVKPFWDSVDIFEHSFPKINENEAIMIEDGMY